MRHIEKVNLKQEEVSYKLMVASCGAVFSLLG
jgi:hypothetical protein